MPTELFFAERTAARKYPGTYPVAGTNYANMTSNVAVTTEGLMLKQKWRGVANFTTSSQRSTSAQRVRFGRFFSAPLWEDVFIEVPTTSANAIQFYMADYESNLSANHCIQQCCIYVWRPSTGQIVGTVCPVRTLAVTGKEPTAVNSIQTTLGNYFVAAGGGVSALEGDILVFEPWSTSTQGANTQYTVRFYFGGATDITAENTVNTTPASRVVFQQDLPLGEHRLMAGWLPLFSHVTIKEAPMGARLVARAKVTPSWLDDHSPFASQLRAGSSSSANLTAQIVLRASLKSISHFHGRIQQSHELSTRIEQHTRMAASFPDNQVGESLSLFFSGIGAAGNNAASIGGRMGDPFLGRTVTTDTLVAGVTVLGAYGVPAGVHEVRVDAEKQVISLHFFGAGRGYEVGVDNNAAAAVCVGSLAAGFIAVRTTGPVPYSAVIQITVAEVSGALFNTPTEAEIEAGLPEYRCLYLYNHTDQPVYDATLELQAPAYDEAYIGTEFSGDVNMFGSVGLDRRFTSTDVTGYLGISALHPYMNIGSEYSVNGLPFFLDDPRTGQVSDGVALQTPTVIDTVHDNGNLLRSVEFGASIHWPEIPPHRGVSFWVKRVPVQVPGPDNRQSIKFIISGDY